MRALVVDVVRRKAEVTVDRAIALSVRMALAGAAGLSRVPGYCTSIDEAVLRIGDRALPILRSRFFFSGFFPRRRARISLAGSGFSFHRPWLGAMEYLRRAGSCTHPADGPVGDRPQRRVDDPARARLLAHGTAEARVARCPTAGCAPTAPP